MATVRLADYRPAPCLIAHTSLRVELFSDQALVEAEFQFEPNPAAEPGPLELQGVELELLELALNGTPLAADAYTLEPTRLVLHQPVELPTGDFHGPNRRRFGHGQHRRRQACRDDSGSRTRYD